MGKKKNKNKISGAVKTAAKTDKKLAGKLKKELANLGEEDIAKVIAEIEREEAKRLQATEKTLPGPPSPRAFASLTPHPINNELILFGGEYHNGQKTEVYNDLLFFNPTSNTWRRVKAPGGPPPRSGHQAVATSANQGELWVFGGEYTSPSETQFYHYKDLWCFSLAEKKWEKIAAPNGPSPRSGHRMALLGRRLLSFGGYSDDGRDCRYFDDLHAFCLDERRWTRLEAAGRGPCARSAAVLLPHGNDALIVYGGFSRVKEGRAERTQTHTDLFRLQARRGAWAWRALAAGGPRAPPARAGQAGAVNAPAGRGYVFGGVLDVEETEEELRGEMSDSLLLLDLDTATWHDVTLRAPAGAAGAAGDAGDAGAAGDNKDEVTVVTDEVFTMTLGPVTSAGAPPAPAPGGPPVPPAPPAPRARMSAMACVQRGVLYVYGGVLEKDDKQFYLSDLHCLDLHKLAAWRRLAAQPSLPDWLGSDSETETDSGGEGDSDSGSDDERDCCG